MKKSGETHFCAPAFSYVLRSKIGSLICHIICFNFHRLEALERSLPRSLPRMGTVQNKKEKRQTICVTKVCLECFNLLLCLFVYHQTERIVRSLFVILHKFLFGGIMLSSFFKRVTSYSSIKPGSV